MIVQMSGLDKGMELGYVHTDFLNVFPNQR